MVKLSRTLIAVANVAAFIAVFYFVAINHSVLGIVSSVVVLMVVDLSAGIWLMRVKEQPE